MSGLLLAALCGYWVIDKTGYVHHEDGSCARDYDQTTVYNYRPVEPEEPKFNYAVEQTEDLPTDTSVEIDSGTTTGVETL